MLIAKPCKASFSVLFTDGKIERFELEKPNSFRRITGCLQSVKMFNEKTFQQLVAIADRLDLK